jgi:hypothetical protein
MARTAVTAPAFTVRDLPGGERNLIGLTRFSTDAPGRPGAARRLDQGWLRPEDFWVHISFRGAWRYSAAACY